MVKVGIIGEDSVQPIIKVDKHTVVKCMALQQFYRVKTSFICMIKKRFTPKRHPQTVNILHVKGTPSTGEIENISVSI